MSPVRFRSPALGHEAASHAAKLFFRAPAAVFRHALRRRRDQPMRARARLKPLPSASGTGVLTGARHPSPSPAPPASPAAAPASLRRGFPDHSPSARAFGVLGGQVSHILLIGSRSCKVRCRSEEKPSSMSCILYERRGARNDIATFLSMGNGACLFMAGAILFCPRPPLSGHVAD